MERRPLRIYGLTLWPLFSTLHFSKLIRPVLKSLRGQGFQSVAYLDDFLLFGTSPEECQKNVNAFQSLLLSLGFRINYSRSQLKPSSSCKYLGFLFNSVQQSISIPPEKKRVLLRIFQDMSDRSQCSIREFASMIESFISVCPAVPYGFLYTKRFEREKFLALDRDPENYEKLMPILSYLREDFE